MFGYALYFLFVAAAIGGVAFLLNKLGQGVPARFSVEEARAHLLKAHPNEEPEDIRELSGSVLFSLNGGRIGIVRSMGKFPLIELLSSEDIADTNIVGADLCIRTTNFADPVINLKSNSASELKIWIEEKLSNSVS